MTLSWQYLSSSFGLRFPHVYNYNTPLLFVETRRHKKSQLPPSIGLSHDRYASWAQARVISAVPTSCKAPTAGKPPSFDLTRGLYCLEILGIPRGVPSTVNFRNSWGVLVFKVGGLCIRLGSVDGHWNWYGGYTDLDNEVEHEIKITINPTGQCLPACPCRTYGLIVVLIYIWYMFPCSVRRCLSACFLFL